MQFNYKDDKFEVSINFNSGTVSECKMLIKEALYIWHHNHEFKYSDVPDGSKFEANQFMPFRETCKEG